jgi:hypothetical protein
MIFIVSSNSFLKFKTYQEIELRVKDVKFDKMMVSINNKMKEKEVLSKVIVDYKGILLVKLIIYALIYICFLIKFLLIRQ